MRHIHAVVYALLTLLGIALLVVAWPGHAGSTPAGAERGGDHFDVRDLIRDNDEREPTEEQLQALTTW